jgi:RNA-directed DNA polymerase
MEYRQYHQTYSGTPQGGIISPLLCNIFLHQLDEYMVSLGANRVQTVKERSQRRSAEYRKVENAISRARRNLRGNLVRQARRELLSKLEKLEKELRITPMYDERHHTRLGYIRYADDCAPRRREGVHMT